MAFSRVKLLASFALLGFMIGTATYLLFNWIVNQGVLNITAVPVLNILLAPWFLSGLAGSGLALITVTLVAYVGSENE